MGFTQDLAYGAIYERKALDYISYDSYTLSKGYFPPYDIDAITDGKHTYYEVKVCRRQQTTHNIIMEHEYKNRPSGINVTQADYYIIFGVNVGVYIVPTPDIKELIKQKKYSWDKTPFDAAIYGFKEELFEKYLTASLLPESYPGTKRT